MRMHKVTIRCGLVALGAAIVSLFAACSTVTQPPQAPAPQAQAPQAQASPAESAVPSGQDTIVATGTRIRRDDFAAASATTVVTADDMENLGVVSVADMINQLPNTIPTVTPEATGDDSLDLGARIENLRGLDSRAGTGTLTLLDSRRMVPVTDEGAADLNTVPSALSGRLETVTGGASATYGADETAGASGGGLDQDAAEQGQEVQQGQQGQLAANEEQAAQEQIQFARRLAAEQAAARFKQRSPLSRVLPGEEVWIIGRPEQAELTADVAEDALGPGVMIARFLPVVLDQPQLPTPAVREIPLPLKHTDVDARIQGYVGTVEVTQEFDNPYNQKIEAVYMFPLPDKAAISEFVMTIGDRKIRGILREKQEAQAIYQQARAQGYRASLLTQRRPNVFEQKVANIEPGKQIDVNITYYETLAYMDGWYSFVFPTVVGPRYNPPGSSDPLTALPRSNFQPTAGSAVRYLEPGTRSAHDISFDVEIDAGVPIEEIVSSHELKTRRDRDDVIHAQLADGAVVPDVDFRLDFRVAGEKIKSNLLTYVDEETGQGYFTMMMYPPAALDALQRQPLELVFVLDCSGSMRGEPIEQAKAAVLAALDRLGPDDTFQIIRFSQNASQFGQIPVAATPENIRAARQYVRNLEGMGGTQMIEGIKAALDFPHDQERLRFVTFLTDGFIGNETDILAAIDSRLGASRIFSFGVGSAPNRYLLERMASTGRGAVAYLSLTDSGAAIMDAFFDRVAHPAMIDVAVDWGSMAVSDVYPSRLPDLFVGRPIIVTGRFTGRPNDLQLTGRAGGERVAVELDYDRRAPEHEFLPALWARLKIAELNDRLAVNPSSAGPLGKQIRETALAYNLMSDYTSFIAVDASEITSGRRGTTVYQAVPVPDGVSYDTTVAR